MSNQHNLRRRPEKRPMDSDKALHRWMGYEDFRAGLGFRKEYEVFTPWNQRNYEAGRQYAAAAVAAKGAAPKWGRNRRLSQVLSQSIGAEAMRASALEINNLFRPAFKAGAVEA